MAQWAEVLAKSDGWTEFESQNPHGRENRLPHGSDVHMHIHVHKLKQNKQMLKNIFKEKKNTGLARWLGE